MLYRLLLKEYALLKSWVFLLLLSGPADILFI